MVVTVDRWLNDFILSLVVIPEGLDKLPKLDGRVADFSERGGLIYF